MKPISFLLAAMLSGGLAPVFAEAPTKTPIASASTLTLPTKDQLSAAADFATPVKFTVQTVPQTKDSWPFGKLITMHSYKAPEQSLHTYLTAIYSAQNFKLKQVAPTWRKLAKMSPPTKSTPLYFIRKLKDGREALSGFIGFGPGGGIEVAYLVNRDRKHYLVFIHSVDFEDDIPEEQRLKNPAEPKRRLIDMLVWYDEMPASQKKLEPAPTPTPSLVDSMITVYKGR